MLAEAGRWEHIACISFRWMDNVDDLQLASSQPHPCSPLASMMTIAQLCGGSSAES